MSSYKTAVIQAKLQVTTAIDDQENLNYVIKIGSESLTGILIHNII